MPGGQKLPGLYVNNNALLIKVSVTRKFLLRCNALLMRHFSVNCWFCRLIARHTLHNELLSNASYLFLQ